MFHLHSHLSIRISCNLVHSYWICIHMYYAFTTTHMYCHVVFFVYVYSKGLVDYRKQSLTHQSRLYVTSCFSWRFSWSSCVFLCVVHATIFPMFGASSLVSLSKQRMRTLWAQENLGSLGFQGRDGIFVFKSLVRDADRAFMALDYYKTYTVNRSVELHNYFATIAEIPQNGTCPGRPSRRSRGV